MKNARLILLCLIVVSASDGPCRAQDDAVGEEGRTRRGLIVYYDFQGADGAVVKDRSGAGSPADLVISDPKAVRRSPGVLEVRGKTVVATRGPAAKIIGSIKRSGELTIEAWIQPAKTNQDGPARIVTLSKDTGERNFTLGQDNRRFEIRVRTTKTDSNGIPSLASPDGSLDTKRTHVVYTRDRSGRARIYLDGQQVSDRKTAGDFQKWNRSFRFALANELTGDRPWLGSYHLVAVYHVALSPEEVKRNFAAGLDVASAQKVAVKSVPISESTRSRINNGLQVLYDFADSDGRVVKDRSGAGNPIDLQIGDMKYVQHEPGKLNVTGKTVIASSGPAKRLSDSIRRSGAVTIEAWIEPANSSQAGPARIVTLSANANERNFTLGQDGNEFEVRFRTTKTSSNGIPSLASNGKSVTTRRTHLVYTRDRAGRSRIYVDGKQQNQAEVSGDTSNWDSSYRLGLANELNDGRAWLGTYHLVAVYNRVLSAGEVHQNFQAGTDAPAVPLKVAENQRAHFFETNIAPLLAENCLQCHDSASKEGGLDLSRKASAIAGGDEGPVIIAGKPSESLLLKSVVADVMPQDRPPLSSQQKELLHRWIEDGATWSVDYIDPMIYRSDQRADQNWLRRLTVDEYIETVRWTVGIDIAKEARDLLPADVRADGFSNTAYNLNVDLGHVDAYAKLAEIIVDRMDLVTFASAFQKSRKLTDDDMRGLIEKMGKRILRGPLAEHEIVDYRGISTSVASAGGDFDDAVGYVIEAMLQSPRFIYQIENQRGDGTAWRISDYELACRLSYIIWGGPPDSELMNAADDGRLDREEVKRQVTRMLEDPRAAARSAQFISEWLDLDRLSNLRPNNDKFPKWDESLADDMRNETLAFFRDVVWEQKRPLSDLLNAQVSFMTPALAKHYAVKPQGEGMTRYDLASVPSRGGILTHGSVLTVGGDNASMVTRGLFVLNDLLFSEVGDPPPGLDTTPVPTSPGRTHRAIATERVESEACGGCHSRFEPLAFGLEKYDGLGSFHETDEHGNSLREDGEILFPGTAKAVPYQSATEMMDLLARSDRVRQCLTRKVTQFALGRPLVAADAATVSKIHAESQKNGGTYASLLTAIVTSDLVMKIRTEEFLE